MATARDRLLARAADVACELSTGQAEALAYEISTSPEPRKIRQVAGLAAPPSVAELCNLWVETGAMDGVGLSDALWCAAQAVKTVSSFEKVELLYTGPDAQSLRRTPQALLEVIRSARERLWIVSYLMGPGMDPVVDAIHERTQAGVTVRMLLDHLHGSFAKTCDRLGQQAPDAKIYIWPDEKRQISGGGTAALHAKCAVADGLRAFVSSANLAGWAMEHNLEVGYLVTGGPTPRSLEQHLETLRTGGGFEPA